MTLGNCDYDFDDFQINSKSSGGGKHKNKKDRNNPNGKYSSKHVRIMQEKKTISEKNRVNLNSKKK